MTRDFATRIESLCGRNSVDLIRCGKGQRKSPIQLHVLRVGHLGHLGHDCTLEASPFADSDTTGATEGWPPPCGACGGASSARPVRAATLSPRRERAAHSATTAPTPSPRPRPLNLEPLEIAGNWRESGYEGNVRGL